MPGELQYIDAVREVVKPEKFGSEHPMREVTEQVAAGQWSPQRAAFVTSAFDELSVGWHADHTSELRLAALEDALERGGIDSGRLVELGCGTGAGTERIATRQPLAAAIDLSPKMLACADRSLAPYLRADCSSLPIKTGSVDVLVLVNMFLFAGEAARVLAPTGQFVWINTMDDETPIYLPPETVLELLPGRWSATASRAGTGIWMVARRHRTG